MFRSVNKTVSTYYLILDICLSIHTEQKMPGTLQTIAGRLNLLGRHLSFRVFLEGFCYKLEFIFAPNQKAFRSHGNLFVQNSAIWNTSGPMEALPLWASVP